MKKVALMTWYDNENYGTALQAYALQSAISEYVECEIVPYKSGHPGYGLKDIINPVLRKNLYWKIYERVILRLFRKKYVVFQEQRSERMNEYIFRKLKFAIENTKQDLFDNVNYQYDAVICGSDQIWNPTRYDKHFFLDFVKDDILKIAYAPSFGVGSIVDNKINNEIKVLLNRFDYLSVREFAGREIISNLLGKDVQVCLDPTLLHGKEFWIQLVNESKIKVPDKYVYCYFLGRNKRNLQSAKVISKTLNLRLVQQPYNIVDYLSGVELIPPSGPEDFLNAIKNSDFVCTDSFHGVIFAIIFEKPFVVFKRFKETNRASQNSRIDTLLKTVGLEERIELSEYLSKDELLDISFEKCKENLRIDKEKSMIFLRSALEDILYKGEH